MRMGERDGVGWLLNDGDKAAALNRNKHRLPTLSGPRPPDRKSQRRKMPCRCLSAVAFRQSRHGWWPPPLRGDPVIKHGRRGVKGCELMGIVLAVRKAPHSSPWASPRRRKAPHTAGDSASAERNILAMLRYAQPFWHPLRAPRRPGRHEGNRGRVCRRGPQYLCRLLFEARMETRTGEDVKERASSNSSRSLPGTPFNYFAPPCIPISTRHFKFPFPPIPCAAT